MYLVSCQIMGRLVPTDNPKDYTDPIEVEKKREEEKPSQFMSIVIVQIPGIILSILGYRPIVYNMIRTGDDTWEVFHCKNNPQQFNVSNLPAENITHSRITKERLPALLTMVDEITGVVLKASMNEHRYWDRLKNTPGDKIKLSLQYNRFEDIKKPFPLPIYSVSSRYRVKRFRPILIAE